MAFSLLFPNAPGDTTTFNPVGDTPNWKCVDDYAGSDADLTYNSTFTTNSGDDLFNLQTLASIPVGEIITHVIFYLYVRYNGGSAAQIIPKVKIGGTVYNQSVINVTSAYAVYPYVYTFVPGTSSPWTVADVNNLQVGYSSGALTINELRVTRLTVEVYSTVNTRATVFLAGD